MATWPADFGHPEVSPDASAPRACRLRVGIPLKWPLADVPWITTTRKSNAVRRPAPRRSWRRLPRRAHPIRHARGRGDGPHGGCRNGAPSVGRREASAHRQPEGIPRLNCATSVQAARRHPGEVAARRRSRITARWCAIHRPAPCTPWMQRASARRASPSARRRSRRRTAGGGREARYGNPSPPTSASRQ